MAAGGLVTIIFTDLVGSTALAQDIGDAAADELRRAHFDSLREAVAATGGTEVKNIGDALMVSYAGAADAIDGAVAMQQAVDRHNKTSHGPRLEMRIGMSAGDATFEGGDWFGAPVIEASRLCGAAEGGQILLTDIVRLLAGSRCRHEIRPVGEIEAKGLPQPLTACEVPWTPVEAETAADLHVPLPRVVAQVDTFDFVGRDAEHGILVDAWKETLGGERRAVFVAGEPGIGKTRLVKEVSRLAHDQGAVVLWGGCEDELTIPFQPFAEALRSYVHDLAPATLRGLLGPLAGELVRLVPDLPHLAPGLPTRAAGDPDSERHRLFEAVADFVNATAARAPLVLVLDDLHWAGKPTLLLLRHLLRGTEHRMLVITTYRDTDLDRTHPLAEMLADLRRQQGVTRVSLSGLDEQGVATFMERTAGHELGEPALDLARALHQETEGNPFFVGEVLRHLAETGALVYSNGRWEAGSSLEEVGIPEGVREVVGRRLSHLDSSSNDVLTVAAVIGREFDVSMLGAIVDGGQEAALDALEAAEASGLLTEGMGGAGTYRFAHALVRTTLYEELPTTRRLRLHRDVARALASRPEADRRLAELARHYAEAAALGEVEAAVEWGRRAGDAAMAELAWEEAATHYERALDAIDLSEADVSAARADLLTAASLALRAMNDSRADDVAFAAVDAARGDERRFAEAVLAACSRRYARGFGSVDDQRLSLVEEALAAIGERDSGIRARLLSALAGELLWSPDNERRRTMADAALELARRCGDRAVLGEVLSQRGYSFDPADSYDAYVADTSEVIELATDLGDPSLLCTGLLSRAPALVTIGERQRGDADLRAAEALLPRLRQPVTELRARILRVASTLLSGRLAEAEELNAAMQDFANHHELADNAAGAEFRLRYERGTLGELEPLFAELAEAQPSVALWRTGLLSVYSTTDRPDEADRHLRALAADNWAIVPRDGVMIVTIAAAARVAGEIGNLEIAAEALELALPHVGELSFTGNTYEQPISMSAGVAATALGRYDRAEALFRDAADLCRRAVAPTFLAATQTHWASMCLARNADGDETMAHELAAAAHETAISLGLGRVEVLSARVLGRL